MTTVSESITGGRIITLGNGFWHEKLEGFAGLNEDEIPGTITVINDIEISRIEGTLFLIN